MAENWIKLHVDVFNDIKIKRIKKKVPCAFEIWVKMLLFCKTRDMGDLICENENLCYEHDELADIFGCSEEEIKKFLDEAIKYKMIEIIENGVIRIINWSKRQPSSSYDRVKKHRSMKQKETGVTSGVTFCNKSNVTNETDETNETSGVTFCNPDKIRVDKIRVDIRSEKEEIRKDKNRSEENSGEESPEQIHEQYRKNTSEYMETRQPKQPPPDRNFTPEFELYWKQVEMEFPVTGNSKSKTFRNMQSIILEGKYDFLTLTIARQQYLLLCKQEKQEAKYTIRAQNFFGEERKWEDYIGIDNVDNFKDINGNFHSTFPDIDSEEFADMTPEEYDHYTKKVLGWTI